MIITIIDTIFIVNCYNYNNAIIIISITVIHQVTDSSHSNTLCIVVTLGQDEWWAACGRGLHPPTAREASLQDHS